MAPHERPLPRPAVSLEHLSDRCRVCASFCTQLTAMLVTQPADALDERELLTRCGQPRQAFEAHVGDLDAGLRMSFERVADLAYHRFATAFVDAPAWDLAVIDGVLALVRSLRDRPGAPQLYFVESGHARDRAMWLLRDAVRERFASLIAARCGNEPLDGVRCEMLCGALHLTLRARVLEDGHLCDVAAIRHDVAQLVSLFGPGRPVRAGGGATSAAPS